MDTQNAIEIKNLSKHYSGFSLKDVSFSLPSGSIMGFIGENGAGKTTTIKALLGLIRPDSGTLQILGRDTSKDEKDIKKNLGVVFADQNFPDDLRPPEITKIMGNIYKTWDKALFENYLSRFRLPLDKRLKDLSKGMKMKLSIAAALSHRPRLLILDEATSGLDPVVRNEILDIFQEFIEDEDHSILMSSHITSDLERIADYITFIHDGQILFSEPKDTLIEDHGIVKCSPGQLEALALTDVVGIQRSSFDVQVMIKNPAAFRNRCREIIVDLPSLEEIMLFYTKGDTK
ncbi:ABC transporter ATP-binding protein [Eubacterium sp. 1001713B170207_170306_E7]|uniref:ABC transporter ATP-binding protein n=1 Tax=Eubacterium sp. 1001713B170207_170306_E7 TaxID=2787097 RepID=UPI00189A5C45|nr:ABC transporter ATP-binding protein [Eubacterium sp. 1001713B170207_170306_E7]